MKSYQPEKLFDKTGKLIPELAELARKEAAGWELILMLTGDYC